MPSSRDEVLDTARKIIDAVGELLGANSFGENRSAWESTRLVVEQHAELLLNDYADKLLSDYLERRQAELDEAGTKEISRWMVLYPVNEKRELLKRCRRLGVTAAFAEMGGKLAEDWMQEFITFSSKSERAGNWVDTKDILTHDHDDLLTPQARDFLAAVKWIQSLTLISNDQLTMGSLFARIQSYGLDAAFADLVEFETDVPPALREALRTAINATNRYHDMGDRISLDEAIRAWELVVGHPDFATSTLHTQRTYLTETGNAYERRYSERGELTDLNRAIELWQQPGHRESLRAEHEPPEFLYYLGFNYERRYEQYLSMAKASRTADPAQAAVYCERTYRDLEEAIRYYEQAYDTADAATTGPPPAPMPMETKGPAAVTKWAWRRRQRARYLNAAGLAYVNKYRLGQRAEDLDRAVDRCRAATQLSDEEERPAPFLYSDLARVLVIRYRTFGQDADLQDVVAAYERALALCDSKDERPVFGFEAATHYGLLLYELGKWRTARTVLERGHNWVEGTRIERTSERARLEFAGATAALYQTLVACCLRDGDELAAFEYASASKGRTFADMLARAQITVEDVLHDQPDLHEDLQRYVTLREAIDLGWSILWQRFRPRPGEEPAYLEYSDNQLFERLGELRRQEKLLWDDLVSRYHSLAALGNAPLLTADATRRLSQELDATLIEYYQHREGWCAFVVTADGIECKPLPDLDDRLLQELAQELARWVHDYPQLGPLDEAKRLLMKWHTAAVQPIRDDLQTARVSIVAPFGAMHTVPYYAAMDQHTGRYVVDDYDLGFAPSLGALWNIWQSQRGLGDSARQEAVQRVLSVAYPGIQGDCDFLKNAVPEAQAVLACFPQADRTPLFDADATPDAVIACAAQQDVIHFSCHGMFDPRYPFQSGLLLSSGWLTVRRIVTELKLDRVRLVTLSACVTAKSDLNAGDELVGLTQAVLTAKTQTVVSSLWPVDDSATRALFTSFYERVADGTAPIRAMREAALAVRGHEKWSHPYYWSPFIVAGLGQFGWSQGIER